MGGDPVQSRDHLANETESVAYRSLRLTDVPAAAELHRSIFHDYFLGHMGQRFLELFYAEFVATPGNYGIIAAVDGKVVGTVIGSADLPRLFHGFYRHHFLSLAAAFLVQVIRDDYVRRHAAVRLTHVIKAVQSRLGVRPTAAPDPAAGPSAQLLSIGVSELFRGSGIAEELTARFCQALAADGVDTVGLSVRSDNPRAIAFYSRTGWIQDRANPTSTTFWRSSISAVRAEPLPGDLPNT